MKAVSIISPSDREVKEICRFINSKLGFKYDVKKKYLITSRLNRRLMQLGFNNYRQYLDLLQNHSEEHGVLFELLTTNTTSFFRERTQFDFLNAILLPQIKAQAREKNEELRRWSAGCSSGEEAYSIAVSCLESLGWKWDIKVLATDINSAKLKTGMEGKYSGEQLKTIPSEWRRKYFLPFKEEKEIYRVIPELRQRVFFRRINLLEHHFLPDKIRLHLIFCRNVFIYLNTKTKQELLGLFYHRLYPGGHVFLGHSESINTTADSRWFALGNCIYQKKVEQ